MFFENVTILPTTEDKWYEEAINSILLKRENKLSSDELEMQIETRLLDAYGLSTNERSLVLGISATGTASTELINEASLAESE